jgi:hypothetical protein
MNIKFFVIQRATTSIFQKRKLSMVGAIFREAIQEKISYASGTNRMENVFGAGSGVGHNRKTKDFTLTI